MQVAADALARAAGDDALRQFDVGPRELAAVRRSAGALQDADEVDDGVVAAQQHVERVVAADVAFDDLDRGQQDQVTRARAVAGRDGDPEALANQAGDDVTTDEAGTTDDEDLVHCRAVFEGADSRRCPGACARYGSSVVPAAFGAITPSRAFSDCAWFSDSAA